MRSSFIKTCPSPLLLVQRLYGASKQFALFLLDIAGAFRLSEYLTSRNLVVLTYHRIVPRDQCAPEWRPPNSLFTDEFERQMAFVAKHFNVLTGDELRAIMSGSADIPRYSLAITFDDGYENNFTYALPILQQHGMKAIFFITTGLIGEKRQSLWFDRLDALLSRLPPVDVVRYLRQLDPTLLALPDARIRPYLKTLPSTHQSEILDRLEQQFGHAGAPSDNRIVYGLMDWDQVRLIAAAGMTIGSHTVNHQILAAVPQAEAHTEVLLSRNRIEEETGQECWCFSYPNGERRDFRPADELAIQKAGYVCAYTQIPGSINRYTPRYAIPRIPVPDTGDMRIFRSHLSGIQRTLRSILRRR